MLHGTGIGTALYTGWLTGWHCTYLELQEPAVQFVHLLRLGGHFDVELGSGLVNQVDGLVGQEALGNVPAARERQAKIAVERSEGRRGEGDRESGREEGKKREAERGREEVRGERKIAWMKQYMKRKQRSKSRRA